MYLLIKFLPEVIYFILQPVQQFVSCIMVIMISEWGNK